MSRVLVTGSAGFIGTYLTTELVSLGYEVRGLDNFSKYGRVDRDYDLVEGDCKSLETVTNALEGCDHLIAGAAKIGGIEYFHKLPYDLLAENERIMAATCDAAIEQFKNGQLKKVTYISSSMVYESTNMWPSFEGDELDVPPPRSSYGFQKLAVEYWARAAYEQYGVPYTIVRPFNCVGVGEDAYMSHVVPDLARKILSGQDPLQIYGDGYQIRHYTYGGDLARGIVMAMEHPAALCQSFNLSSSVSTTVLELAHLIWRKINKNKPFRHITLPAFEHDVACRIPDTYKAETILGFKAETSLEEMVDITIEAIRKEQDNSYPMA